MTCYVHIPYRAKFLLSIANITRDPVAYFLACCLCCYQSAHEMHTEVMYDTFESQFNASKYNIDRPFIVHSLVLGSASDFLLTFLPDSLSHTIYSTDSNAMP